MFLAQGALQQACTTATRLEVTSPESDNAFVVVAIATFRAQLAFFLGSYRDAIQHATAAIAAADASADATLRAAARSGTCFVLGNLAAPCMPDVIAQRLALSKLSGDRWEEAVTHNDLASLHLDRGEVAQALAEIERAEALAASVEEPTLALNSVIRATRAQALLSDGRYAEATECALTTVRNLERSGTPHPYLLGMASVIAVQALAAEGRIDEATVEGHRGVERLGEFLPLARSAILASLADTLRQSGRTDEAYDALSESVALERRAARQFAALQHDLSQAVAAHALTRIEAEHLRDEADRDWLTGLHNRRYLARLPLHEARTVGIALVDLDNFKLVNDTHGHEVGDRVLVRIAQLLVAAARADDVVVRLGGDEFVVVMVGADREHAFACAHRLHTMLSEESWESVAPHITVGASVGFAAGPGSRGIDELIGIADRYLYGVKQSGRGRVSGATQHA
jgi:diguanylate cyclase (GGDEF)-like protein